MTSPANAISEKFAQLMQEVVRPSLAQREWRRLTDELAQAA